ncbi:hypothetical protein [Acidaminobacter sp.]|uniref:hypothetical protein n=1 Tax=Acidaminobacter sp. TaxID=1872102 RepID=UPI00256DF8F8|nr:hypothetical protein [Acidaminobacter sp.]MDK9711335.1 hypothetical protein [Acidaminobacter sp.]
MIESHRSSGGWLLAFCGWLLSAVVVPFIPEIMSGGRILGYPLMEYVATIGLFAVILLAIWIPAGFKASKLYRFNGPGRAVSALLKVFILQILVFTLIFRFFWNS